MNNALVLGLSGPDVIAILKQLRALGLPCAESPEKIFSDNKNRKITTDWIERWARNSKYEFFAAWSDDNFLSLDSGMMVKLRATGFQPHPRQVLDLLKDIDFAIASTDGIFPEWYDGTLGEKYLGEGFADLHWSHGWACLFKGEGHRRLVSRRWLDFGPWRTLRGNNDTTLVQFHDMEADAKTALEQAKPGHARMGISSDRKGGFLQSGFVYRNDLDGRYFEKRRVLDIVVNGRDVTQSEMLDACAARYYQALGPDSPLDNVAYTFVNESEARAHLHELWLRELECWAIIKGEEVRLDVDYRPTPNPPEWVRLVEERERR